MAQKKITRVLEPEHMAEEDRIELAQKAMEVRSVQHHIRGCSTKLLGQFQRSNHLVDWDKVVATLDEVAKYAKAASALAKELK